MTSISIYQEVLEKIQKNVIHVRPRKTCGCEIVTMLLVSLQLLSMSFKIIPVFPQTIYSLDLSPCFCSRNWSITSRNDILGHSRIFQQPKPTNWRRFQYPSSSAAMRNGRIVSSGTWLPRIVTLKETIWICNFFPIKKIIIINPFRAYKYNLQLIKYYYHF